LWVKWVCERLAEFVWRRTHGRETGVGHSLWLSEAGEVTATG